jgi:hypothetical protein
MANLSLQRFDNDGIELLIDTETGESFASQAGYARMSGVQYDTIRKRVQRLSETSSDTITLKTAEIETPEGIRSVTLIPESIICRWIVMDNPSVAENLMRLGVRVFLHEMAGYKVTSEATDPPRPLSEAELEIEKIRVEAQADIEKMRELKGLDTSIGVQYYRLEQERVKKETECIKAKTEELRLERAKLTRSPKKEPLYPAGTVLLTPEQLREKLIEDIADYIDRLEREKGITPKVRDLHHKFQSRKIPDEKGNLVKVNSAILRSLLPEASNRRVKVSRTH